ALQLIFPGADPQLLRGYFEASGNVLDAAIRGFKDYLASGSALTNADAASSGVASDVLEMNARTNSIDWAELIVREMSAASDLIDAKSRAFRILELFDKSAAGCNTPDEKQKMREEHKILKQMLGGLLHQNGVLKRAFLIQHNRLKDYQDMVRERSQFKEIVDKYQQQIKALEELCAVVASRAVGSSEWHIWAPQPRRLLGWIRMRDPEAVIVEEIINTGNIFV
uniref:CUE domain-containing protein n=2 Tax=Aegilops tauschii subsp. strangulata TaxID=200361 RepID=A0A453T758_AEGTS